jgi:hypothetical protein
MFTVFRRFLFGPPRPETRMTEAEVRVLADKAAKEAHIDDMLTQITVERINSRIMWTASTATKGSGWCVTIDDTTGEVGRVRRWGFR